jgi:outer membrane usher protein
LRRNSRQRADARQRLGRSWLLATSAVAGLATAAHAQPGTTPQAQERTVTVGSGPPPQSNAPQRLNPTGRTITLTVPAKDGNFYIGDIVVTIDTDDHVTFSSQRLLDLLSNIVDAHVVETLRGSLAGRTTMSPQDLAGTGITVTYNPQTLELALGIPSEMRASRAVQVSPLDRARIGTYVRPATFSAYVNVRGSVDYIHSGPDTGLADPVFFLDGASRIGAMALESEAVWQPGSSGKSFQRQGTRWVYDDTHNVVRWTFGDLQTVSRGFQSTPDMLGVSVYRSYSVLQPQTVVRPRGDRSFSLDRPSTVEVLINGQLIRRVQLAPGNYNLRDFPFTQGANDVRLQVTDDTGRTQLIRFNVFFDQSQLARGLSEFGFFAGVDAPLAADGPDYTDNWEVTGFYRRGVTDNLTLGGNFQANEHSQLIGAEAVIGTDWGTMAANIASSHVDGFGAGFASTFTYQRLIQSPGGRSDSLAVSLQTHSRNFGALGTIVPSNPFDYELGATYSHAFNDYVYAGLDLHYSHGRGVQVDVQNYRGTVGWRLTPTISMTADVLYQDSSTGSDIAGLLSITARLGDYSTVRGDYDSRGDRARIAYQTLHGQGVGSYNLSLAAERSDSDSGVDATFNYVANRAEIGLSHFGTFDGFFSGVSTDRTSLRVGTSLAVADGNFSIGRPIYDSFAIVTPHRTLQGAEVYVDPTPYGYTARTGALGSAIEPNMSSYNERTITVDAPNAPQGIDLGQGSFRVFPPYRAGYHLVVGSDYSVTAIGRLIGEDGQPVSLVAGTATELAHPDKEPVTLFTNRDGRFGAAGLAPGRWRIEMLTEPRSTYVITIPATAVGVVRLGDVQPSEGR